MSGNDAAFEALLADTLAPPAATPDRAFVARVDRALAEAERYREARRRLWRGLSRDGAAVASLAASFAILIRIPQIGAMTTQAPTLAAVALGWLLLLWIMATRHPVEAIR